MRFRLVEKLWVGEPFIINKNFPEVKNKDCFDLINRTEDYLNKMSESEFLSYVEEIASNQGAVWILPNGKVLRYEYHAKVAHNAFKEIFKKLYDDGGYNFEYSFEIWKDIPNPLRSFDSDKFNERLVRVFNWLKLNTGESDKCYIMLPPEKLSSAQMRKLDYIFTDLEDNDLLDYTIDLHTSSLAYKCYPTDKYSVSDIIKRISQFYMCNALLD